MGIFKRASERRAYLPPTTGDPWSIPSNGSLAPISASGIQVTEDTALRLVAVMSCVRVLAEAVSNLPLEAVRSAGDIREVISPAPVIVADPFGGLANAGLIKRREGLTQIMVSLLLRGNAYMAVLSRDSRGRPTRLRVLHPDRVECTFDESGARCYKVDRVPVPSADDIVHMVGLSAPEAATGMSVIAYARQAIGLGLAAEEFGAKFYGSGAHMTGIISVPGDLDKERARGMKEAFEASHSGLANAHSVGILSGGAEWKPISVAPEDAQFLGTRAAQDLSIAMLFGVPPHMLGLVDKTTSWGTGIEQQTLGFVTYTLGSWIGRFEDTWSAMLPTPQAARFNVNEMLRSDAAGRYAVYGAARASGLLTQNEIRALENYPPIDGGDDINAGLNSTASPIKDIGAKTSMNTDAMGQPL